MMLDSGDVSRKSTKRGWLMRKKWLIAVIAVVIAGAGFIAARANTNSKPKEQEPPFRLGKVQTEDLQVSVREVGVVDPEIKVDVKSTVSGRVLGPRGARGDAGRQGRGARRGRARRQPGAVAIRRSAPR